jgi:hypothetical protein
MALAPNLTQPLPPGLAAPKTKPEEKKPRIQEMTLLAVLLKFFDCNLPRYRIKMKALHPSCKNLTYKNLKKAYTHGTSPATSYSTPTSDQHARAGAYSKK